MRTKKTSRENKNKTNSIKNIPYMRTKKTSRENKNKIKSIKNIP
jgi:hypothetical protein